jgi:ubiquinone/menaquinone biosynthesis C-methylase UbiE
MIAAAVTAEAQEPLGISYHAASFSDLSAFPAGSFDLAISTMALMDGPDFEGATRAAHRVLRPGRRSLFQRAASLLRNAGAEMDS